MIYRLLADVVVAVHFGFVLFVIFGGLFALRWPKAAWIHVPVALWGAGIEFLSGICPLTPLENHLRRLGGEAGYSGGFVERYILPVLYPSGPAGLSQDVQLVLGSFVVVINAVVYFAVWRRHRKKR
jgi:hypothetical protein